MIQSVYADIRSVGPSLNQVLLQLCQNEVIWNTQLQSTLVKGRIWLHKFKMMNSIELSKK